MPLPLFSRYTQKELVYIPYGADKGDCPYCYYGVLRREQEVEKTYNVGEGYICPGCNSVFVELGRRDFHRIAVWGPIKKRKNRKRRK